ncbi:MAG TPA: SPOR domain-containing protein, partial [Micropepsaceae bacterium]
MNTHQRGVYQPAMDNAQVYDLSNEEVEEEEHSRLPLLIVIALLVLAAFAGVVWLAYNQGVARGRAGAVVVIAAPDGPVRTAPLDPGGTPAPYTGLKVYGQSLPPDQEAQGTTLAPQAPAGIPASSPAQRPQPAPAVVTSDTPPVRLNPDAPTLTASKPPPPAAVKPAVQTAAATSAAAVAAAVPSQSAALTSAASGKAVLQIGAYESPEIANGAWTSFKSRYADVAAKLGEDVQKADLGAKGTWYRLRVGPFADKAAA